MENGSQDKKTMLRVSVSGKNSVNWSIYKDKFLEKAAGLLDTVINFEDGSTIKEEAKQFSTELLKYAKEKLKEPGIQNQKTLAEIDKIYSEREREFAETRKLNAEAREIELKNKITELKLSLGIMKAMLIGVTDEESIIFLKQIESFRKTINEFSIEKQ